MAMLFISLFEQSVDLTFVILWTGDLRLLEYALNSKRSG
jgi:hypothetical protein